MWLIAHTYISEKSLAYSKNGVSFITIIIFYSLLLEQKKCSFFCQRSFTYAYLLKNFNLSFTIVTIDRQFRVLGILPEGPRRYWGRLLHWAWQKLERFMDSAYAPQKLTRKWDRKKKSPPLPISVTMLDLSIDL